MLAGALKQDPVLGNVHWQAQNDDIRKPMLVITAPAGETAAAAPAKDLARGFVKSGFCIRIHATAPVRNIFSGSRLLPDRNGVRADVDDTQKGTHTAKWPPSHLGVWADPAHACVCANAYRPPDQPCPPRSTTTPFCRTARTRRTWSCSTLPLAAAHRKEPP